MSKIGVIFCSYGMPEYVERSMSSWLSAKETYVGGNEFLIAAVSCPFKQYFSKPDLYTPKYLNELLENKKIDFLFSENLDLLESEVRDKALKFLLSQKCDIVILADGDEFFNVDQIGGILNFVKLDGFTSWFRFSYKNYVFDTKTYLFEPFTPPRLFKVNTNGYSLSRFRWDNDACYQGVITIHNKFQNNEIDYTQMPSRIVPKTIAFIDHYTWLNNERAKDKVAYQIAHFGHCSFKWNEVTSSLEFDESYYKKFHFPIPQIIRE